MEWVKIFDSEEEATQVVPVTKAKQLQINGRKICLAHTQTGFYAVADACPHLGESLSKGTTNYLNEVVCPHLFWQIISNQALQTQHIILV